MGNVTSGSGVKDKDVVVDDVQDGVCGPISVTGNRGRTWRSTDTVPSGGEPSAMRAGDTGTGDGAGWRTRLWARTCEKSTCRTRLWPQCPESLPRGAPAVVVPPAALPPPFPLPHPHGGRGHRARAAPEGGRSGGSSGVCWRGTSQGPGGAEGPGVPPVPAGVGGGSHSSLNGGRLLRAGADSPASRGQNEPPLPGGRLLPVN